MALDYKRSTPILLYDCYKLPKRNLAYKRKHLTKKELSHKVVSFVGVDSFDLLFIMHEIIKVLHESILLETVTLVIYSI